jgi:hypothetical protein
MAKVTSVDGHHESRDEQVRRKIAAMSQEDLPEIIRDLKLRTPKDIDAVLDGMGLDIKSLSEGNRSVETDIYAVTFVTTSFDETGRSSDHELTRKTWRLLEAAKENRGHNGLKQALTGLLECIKLRPHGLPNIIDDAYRQLKQKD